MEVKGINSVNLTRPAYSNQAVQKNQVAFQGLKEKAFEAGVKAAPLGMIPEPMHFIGTLVTKLPSLISKLYDKTFDVSLKVGDTLASGLNKLIKNNELYFYKLL